MRTSHRPARSSRLCPHRRDGATRPGRQRASVEQMRRWYLAGESNATIGARLGLHQSKVRRVLIEDGVTMRTRRDQVALQDQRDGVRMPTCEELASGYAAEGLTIAELAQRHEISTTRITLMLRRCGIERRPGGARADRLAAE